MMRSGPELPGSMRMQARSPGNAIVSARATWNKRRLVDAAFLLEKHSVWEGTQLRRRLAVSALPAVLVKHPLRHTHLYAIYVSRKHMPLEIRKFIDRLIEVTRIAQLWEDPVEQSRSNGGTPIVSLAPGE